MQKKVNYMGLSELMRMIIIFVTFCLDKKKIPQGFRGKKYTNQFSLQSKNKQTNKKPITIKKMVIGEHIDNYLKHEWIKCSNQKTQAP